MKSQSGDFEYDVRLGEYGWLCSCPDSTFRGSTCKHIWGVEISFELRKVVEAIVPKVLKPLGLFCRFCESEAVVKHSVRHNRYGDLQRYSCKGCGKRFSVNIGFERMKATPQAITSAMQLYFTGESLRSVQKFLRLQGVNVSHQSVWNWIQKYVGLMGEYMDRLTPSVSDKWRTDEIYLKMRGNTKYLFAMMDDETRYWIAQQVAENKGISDVRSLFREAKEVAGKKPKVLISDGAYNFATANKKEWWTHHKGDRTRHVRDIRFGSEVHNNKMERMNGEIRDREKVMRSLKNPQTPILKGLQVYHNYFRPHEALDGQTPARKAGIQIEGENPWITVIQNASRGPKVYNAQNQPDGPST
ncbi:MAG: DDE-type integrase/transposase/recombinase [Nitrososphaerota archaeon]|nr:DDE-type integrase/transposase/recombinase [Nitrososphaerota archaeon]MDG7024455.1 DDE-type integrase/transposase/recombinase [Nitrososphaerota archaeon]